MRSSRIISISNFAAWCGLLLALPVFAQTVYLDGASAGVPLAREAVSAYAKSIKDAAAVQIAAAGTSLALERLCTGRADAVIATRAPNPAEQAQCTEAKIKILEIPIARDALSVVVNQRNSFVKSISVGELRTVWAEAAQGKVTRWNQVNPAWPDAPLKLFGPGAGDAVFFNDAILGKDAKARGDFQRSDEDAMLVQGIARDLNALSYLPMAYLEGNRTRLRAVPVSAKKGAIPVEPTEQNVTQGAYEPLTRPILLYVNTQSLARAEVSKFLDYLLTNGARIAKGAHYVALPDAAYRVSAQSLKAAALSAPSSIKKP